MIALEQKLLEEFLNSLKNTFHKELVKSYLLEQTPDALIECALKYLEEKTNESKGNKNSRI